MTFKINVKSHLWCLRHNFGVYVYVFDHARPNDPIKNNLNIQVPSKSNMAANMAPEHIRFVHKNVNNDI